VELVGYAPECGKEILDRSDQVREIRGTLGLGERPPSSHQKPSGGIAPEVTKKFSRIRGHMPARKDRPCEIFGKG
jgi:hypothetical protein